MRPISIRYAPSSIRTTRHSHRLCRQPALLRAAKRQRLDFEEKDIGEKRRISNGVLTIGVVVGGVMCGGATMGVHYAQFAPWLVTGLVGHILHLGGFFLLLCCGTQLARRIIFDP